MYVPVVFDKVTLVAHLADSHGLRWIVVVSDHEIPGVHGELTLDAICTDGV